MTNEIIAQQILTGWKLTIYVSKNVTMLEAFIEAAKQLEREIIKKKAK